MDVYDDVILPSGEEEPIFGGLGVPNSRLSFRFNHVRDDDKGSLLSSGEATYRVTELQKADPLGIGGTVDVGDDISIGAVDISLVVDTALDTSP
mmetsp:Transcript_24487/g.40827  ORF Transcript_24487/g.40827 Transcript_24487/m.40827 type:complete len:94 (+) Transcript_24487:555-836(+)